MVTTSTPHLHHLAAPSSSSGPYLAAGPHRSETTTKGDSRRVMKAFVTRRKRPLAVLSVLTVAIATAVAVSVGGAQARSSADELKGAGATFPAPLIAAWQQKYEAAKGVKVTYNPIGSGGGISAISNKTVDFGASDAPMTPDQFKSCGGCVELPWALSAHLGHVQPARASRTTCTSRARSSRASTSARSRSGTTRRSRPSTRASTCLPLNHPGLPERLERHDVQLHDVPEHGQQAVEVAGRTRHDRQLAGRRRCTRKLRRLGRRLRRTRARSATRTSRTP